MRASSLTSKGTIMYCRLTMMKGNPTKDDADQAMDFFHGLDNGCYTDFKVQLLNGLQIKFITNPKDVIFTLANNGLKPKTLASMQGGWIVWRKKGDSKTGDKDKTQGNEAKMQAPNQGNRKQEREKKLRSKKLECFICGDKYYASSCPQRKGGSSNQDKSREDKDDGFVNAV